MNIPLEQMEGPLGRLGTLTVQQLYILVDSKDSLIETIARGKKSV
jgi:hypothetical protein